MPNISATTKSAEQIWATPDGQRKLFKVSLEVDGKPFEAKTWSQAIASAGFSGQLETYEKDGKAGVETFVRQVQKEGGFQGGGNRQPKDEKAIGAMWAIGQAVSIFVNSAQKDKFVPFVEARAKELFAMVDRVKVGSSDNEPLPAPPPDEVINDISEEVMLDDFFDK